MLNIAAARDIAGVTARVSVGGTMPLADSVAHALDLDVFEIRAAETAGAGPTITVGRQVSDRLIKK